MAAFDLVRVRRVDPGEEDGLHVIGATLADEVLQQRLNIHAVVGLAARAVRVSGAVGVEIRVLGLVDRPDLINRRVVVLGAAEHLRDEPPDVRPGHSHTVTGDVIAEDLPAAIHRGKVVGRRRMLGHNTGQQWAELEHGRALRGAAAELASDTVGHDASRAAKSPGVYRGRRERLASGSG